MHTWSSIILAAAIAAAAPAALAQESAHADHGGHAHHGVADSGDVAPSADGLTEGEVKKIDPEAGKITLRHGAIVNLGMAPMTMVLRVKEPAMLDQVKMGDKVRFAADRVEGAVTIVRLEKLE